MGRESAVYSWGQRLSWVNETKETWEMICQGSVPEAPAVVGVISSLAMVNL